MTDDERRAEIEAVAVALHERLCGCAATEPEDGCDRWCDSIYPVTAERAVAALDRVRDARGDDEAGVERVGGKMYADAIRAAREVDALFGGGGPGRWTYAGKRITDDAAEPLLSMHDYLNTLAYHASAINFSFVVGRGTDGPAPKADLAEAARHAIADAVRALDAALPGEAWAALESAQRSLEAEEEMGDG